MVVLILPDKGLGDPDAVDALCDIGVQVALLVGLDLPGLALLLLDEHDHQCQHGQAAETDHRQPGVAEEHEYNNEEKIAQIRDGIHDTVAQKVAQAVHVVHHAHLYLAVGPVVIVGEGQLLQVVEDIRADGMDDVLAHRAHDFDLKAHGDTGIGGHA